MNFTWKWSLLVAIILASVVVVCVSDQEASFETIIPATGKNSNQPLVLQQLATPATIHLIGSSTARNYNHQPNVRRRTEEESNSAYTAPRSRRFLQYSVPLHIDVADRFSHNGKVYVSLLFLMFWVLSVISRCPKRKAGMWLVGALLMIGLRHLMMKSGHGPYFDWKYVLFWKPLIVQFGLMLTTISLEKREHGGLVRKIGEKLDDPVPWKRCRNILFFSTVGSAVLSRDMIVFLFSGTVVDLCIRHSVGDPMPYLLSLSTASNIGSAMTLSGTFSNLLVSTLSYEYISWSSFATNLLLPTISASIINSLLIMLFFRSELFHGSAGRDFNSDQVYEMVGNNDTNDEECHKQHNEYVASGEVQQEWSLWSVLQLVCVGAYITCFATGLSMQRVSIGGGLFMLILHLCNRLQYQGCPNVSQCVNAIDNREEDGENVSTIRVPIDYTVLLSYAAQFLMVGSLNDTGVPQAALNLTLDTCAEQLTSGLCMYRFALVIVTLSAIFSSASAVQMFAATIPYSSPYEWVQASFAANMAGNLAVFGSSTHSTVGDLFTRSTGKSSPVSIRSYTLFGFVSGVLSLLAGIYLLSYFHFVPDCSERLGDCV